MYCYLSCEISCMLRQLQTPNPENKRSGIDHAMPVVFGTSCMFEFLSLQCYMFTSRFKNQLTLVRIGRIIGFEALPIRSVNDAKRGRAERRYGI